LGVKDNVEIVSKQPVNGFILKQMLKILSYKALMLFSL